MTKVINIDVSKDMTREVNNIACNWVAKLDRTLSSTEIVELRTWLNESEQHKNAFYQMVKLWDKMECLSQLSEIFDRKHEAKRSRRSSFVAIAASLALVSVIGFGAVLGGYFQNDLDNKQVVLFQTEYSTQVGEQTTVLLHDKTEITLNTNSAVRVTYTNKQRLIELERGELHVDVAHNKEQPLSVSASDIVFKAVGTSFNVEMLNNEIEMIVTDGKVLVSTLENSENSENSLIKQSNVGNTSDAIEVVKGQKVKVNHERSMPLVIDEESEQIAADLAWQGGDLVFQGETLDEVMHEVARYTEYNFEFAEDEIKQFQVAGLFKTDDVDGLLKSLEYNFDVVSERSGTSSTADVITLSMKKD